MSNPFKDQLFGYKIMTLREETGLIHSLADSRLTIPLKKGVVLRGREGIWLGTTIEYVQVNYGSFDPDCPEECNFGEYEVRCRFLYVREDIISGSHTEQGFNDTGSEFSVRKAILESVYNVTSKVWLLV